MGPVPKPCRSRWTDAPGRRSECAPRAQGQACRRSPWADRFFWTPVVAERVEHPVRQCVKPSLGSCAAALRRTRRNPACRVALHGRKGVSGQSAPGAPGWRRRRPRPPAVRFRARRSTGPETRRNGRLRTVLRGAVQRSGPREGFSREPFSAYSPWSQNWATTEAAGRAGDGGRRTGAGTDSRPSRIRRPASAWPLSKVWAGAMRHHHASHAARTPSRTESAIRTRIAVRLKLSGSVRTKP